MIPPIPRLWFAALLLFWIMQAAPSLGHADQYIPSTLSEAMDEFQQCKPGTYTFPSLDIPVETKFLTNKSKGILRSIAEILTKCDRIIRVEGYSDTRDPGQEIQRKAALRVKVVRNFLLRLGVPEDRIQESAPLGGALPPDTWNLGHLAVRTVAIELMSERGKAVEAQKQIEPNAKAPDHPLEQLPINQEAKPKKPTINLRIDPKDGQHNTQSKQQIDSPAHPPEQLAMNQGANPEKPAAKLPENNPEKLAANQDHQLEKPVTQENKPAESVAAPAPAPAQAHGTPATSIPLHHHQEGDDRQPPDIAKILQRGTLVVAMHARDHPPFFMVNDQGELYGLDIQLAQGIAKKLGVRVEFNRRADTFNGVVDQLARGEADLAISKLSLTMQRALVVRFSKPYITLHQGLLINRLQMARIAGGRSATEVIKNMDSRNRIGVMAGSSYEGFAKEKFPEATIVSLERWQPDVVDAVVNGSVFAAYRDELEIKKISFGHPELALKLQTAVLKDSVDPIAIAVPWQSDHLRSWIDLYLESLQLDMTANKLLDTYPEIFIKGNRPH